MIVSDVIKINKITDLSANMLEKYLIAEFGPIIRWAIIEATDNELKLCISYEKGSIK